MKVTTIQRVLPLLGGKEKVNIFADNAKYYVDSENNVILFDDSNEVVFAFHNTNSAKGNDQAAISVFEYDMIQYLESSLSKENLIAFLNDPTISTVASAEDVIRLKGSYRAYNSVTELEAAIDALPVDPYTAERKYMMKVLYNVFNYNDNNYTGRKKDALAALDAAIEAGAIPADAKETLVAFTNKNIG